MRAFKCAALLAALVAVAAVGPVTGASASRLIYKNVPKKLPVGFPSLGFECCSTAQFGGMVEFAGTARHSPTVSVYMESWACEASPCATKRHATFEWPIALTIYEVGPENKPGPVIGESTDNFKIPYRPSPNPECPATPEGQGWGKECNLGIMDKISFNFPGVTLPAKAIIGVAYNTETYGEDPTGKEGPEDSLNVGVNANYVCVKENPSTKVCEEYKNENTEGPLVGSDPLPEQVFLNTTYGALACGGAEGYWGLSGPCWKYEQPAFEVRAHAKA